MRQLNFACFIVFLLLFQACETKECCTNLESTFDKKTMLTFYADSLIIPSFKNLAEKTDVLDASIIVLANSLTSENLINVQNNYKAALIAWQKVSPYDFTYSEDEAGAVLGSNINIFPASISLIETAISAGTINFTNGNKNGRGFQALDYLLFKSNDNATILTSFSNTNRLQYLLAVSSDIKVKVRNASNNWSSNRNEFILNDGTAAGSSVSELYNSFLLNFETLKNFKLRLPLGKSPGQTEPDVWQLECFYSGFTLELLKENMEACENAWYGRTRKTGDFKGFVAYLNAVSGGTSLVKETEIQLTNLNNKLMAIPEGKLSDTIEDNFSTVEAAYNEILKLTRYWKSDMSSLLGISITYSSGDGD